MLWSIRSSTSSAILTAVSRTLVIRMVVLRNYLVSLISPSTVSVIQAAGIFPTHFLAELSIAPDKNVRLVPPHERKNLAARGLDLEGFVPMSKDEMMARLD